MIQGYINWKKTQKFFTNYLPMNMKLVINYNLLGSQVENIGNNIISIP